MYERILLAYDGSESGQKALLDCRDIAQWSHAKLFLVAVTPPPPPPVVVEYPPADGRHDDVEREHYQAILDEGLRRLRGAGHTVQGELLTGERVEAITSYAARLKANLIVVGHHHLGSWAARWWRGSSSPALIEHAPCSVLVAIA